MKRNIQIIQDFFPIVCLILVILCFFGKVLCTDKALFGSDFILFFYPVKHFIYDYFQNHGALPFWNPYVLSGVPILANIQASMFYPLGFLYYLLPPVSAYLYSTLLHCALGAIFMYAFMRSMGCFRPGAFLAGFLFICNGYFMAHLYAGHLSFVQNYIWMPLIFLFVIRFWHTCRMGYAILAGIALGVQILGGFPQIAFYTLLAIIFFGLYMTWLNRRTNRISNLFRLWGGTFFLILTGFALAAIQLLPTYEFMQLSTRGGGVGYEFATMDSFPPRNMLTFFFPLLFGSPIDGSYWINDRTWEFWEYCGYGGIVTLIVIGFAMGKIKRDPMGFFFIFLGLMAIFLAFGKYNPLYPIIYRLPGFHSFRLPAQILFLYVFALIVLSGKAMEVVFADEGFYSRKGKIIFSILFMLTSLVVWTAMAPEHFCNFVLPREILAEMCIERFHKMVFTVRHAFLSGVCFFFGACLVFYLREKQRIGQGVLVFALLGLIMADTASFVFPLIRTFDMQKLQGEGRLLSAIKDQSGVSRTLINGKCFIENAGLWYNFQDIQGYDPLILRRYMAYVNKSQHLLPDNKVVNLHYIWNINNNLIRMLNLKYVVDCRNHRIQKTGSTIPRCYVVHQMAEKEPSEILDFMMKDSFEPLEKVVFESGQAPDDFFPKKPEMDAKEFCRILRYENDEIDLTAYLKTSGFLVMSEIYYPGWEVYVNGKKQEIFTGNYLFRVLPLAKGRHKIHMVFRPFSFQLGSGISLATLLGVLIVGICLIRRRKQCEKDVNEAFCA